MEQQNGHQHRFFIFIIVWQGNIFDIFFLMTLVYVQVIMLVM